MALTAELASQFAKATVTKKQAPTESTVQGTTVIYEGKTYVKLDGSDLLTPVKTTSSVEDGDRVNVTIKDHTATITGNQTDPSASSGVVAGQGSAIDEMGTQISEFEIIVADKVSVKDLEANYATIDQLNTKYATIGELDANKADIRDLQAENVTITGRLDAVDATIENLEATKIDASIVEAEYATIKNLEATDAKIYNLEATYGDFVVITTDKFTAVEADIDDLRANMITVDNLDAKYANIDFANIGEAAIENFYAKSGIIKDMTIEDGIVTGELTSVRINADYITSGTLQTDRLLVKGEDGLYYKLNIEGGATVTEKVTQEDLQNGIHGTIIIAESITADKISVSDLVAFEATIGGFNITESSIYSGVKTTVDNTTRGIYLDSAGQMAIGDAKNYIKYYKDTTDNAYKLAISAASIILGASGKSVEEAIEESANIEIGARNLIRNSETMIFEDYYFEDVDSEATLLTDENDDVLLDENDDMLAE